MDENEYTLEDRPPLSVEADRARRLFLYLRDLSELRSKSVKDLVDYQNVVWLNDLPSGPHGWSLFDETPAGADSEVWLEVDRVQLPKVPQPPDSLNGWMRLSDLARADLDEPGLIDSEELEAEIPIGVESSYQEYLDQEWRPWHRHYLDVKPAYDFYTTLFSMSEKRQSLGEVFELVFGLGLLTWNRRDQRIQRHLITAPAELIVDEHTGALELRPSDAEGRNRLELDMLDPHDRGPAEILQELTDLVEGSDPLALGDLAPEALTRWVNRAHSEGTFESGLEAPPATEDLTITLAPAVILRRRGQRTLSTLLNGIAEQIGEGIELPEGVIRLVTTSDQQERPVSRGAIRFADPEVYFPLPSNEEQQRILDRMQQRRGVVVQGPPGTGKSHTIANLVTHLLAQGRRVLVTSHTERALRVLRDKLPEDVRPLCISLLGSDRQSIRDLEAAVEAISARQGDWTAEVSERQVEQLRQRLHDLRGELVQKRNRLRQINESDSHPIEIGPYRGTNQHIARQLASESPALSWIPDQITGPKPSLSNHEFREFLELDWSLPPEAEAAADAELPDPRDLTRAGELKALFEKEAEFAQRRVDATSRFGEWMDGLDRYTSETLARAEQAIHTFTREMRRLSEAEEWTSVAVTDVIGGRRAVWDAMHDELTAHHAALDRALSALGAATVEIEVETPPSVLRSGTKELIQYGEGGSTLRTGVFAMGAARKHRFILDKVRVDGAQPLTVERLRLLEAHLSVQHELEAIENVWESRLAPIHSPSFTQRRAAYAEHRDLLGRTIALADLLAAAVQSLDEMSAVPRPEKHNDAGELEHIASGLSAELDNRRSAEVTRAIGEAHDRLGEDAHPVVARLREAVDARSADDYGLGLEELDEKRRLGTEARRCRELSSRLSDVPRLKTALPKSPDDVWIDRSTYFDRAWRWRYADSALERLLDPEEPRRLGKEIETLEHAERSTLLGVTTELAWSGMFRGLTMKQDQALTAWTHAIRRIGRGTGKYAEQHRRTAREYMGIARDAIPAWIMPTHRIAESLDAAPEPFDVVIVDEASQSGVESLFLFYVGKQVVVVGDDQQIAPDAVGVDMLEVARLQRQHLEGLPFQQEFGPTSSLFDQADIRFGNRVVLREHFRCMPEIIEFSNRISYPDKSLWPLRQYGTDRLDPIKTVYLEHGYREGRTRAINRPEAEEIVARIDKLCSDPRYDNKTIGVISLQGDAQAQLIERILIERLGPQVMAERSIICGDAYAFQGDERHVMFLSMVAAPNERIGALSNPQARRRFNVAGSRAQDQVWLMHSVRPSELSTTDMRRAILEYYLDPDVEHWEELTGFDESILNEPFESHFEQDVYLRLRERGFRVAPQVRAGGYRIDLVINGAGAKLAVECDGDEWHGPERWQDDSVRQRRLERAGWRFVRIRGSEFYRAPDSALEEVWRKCGQLGIVPGAEVRGEIGTAEAAITGPESESERITLRTSRHYPSSPLEPAGDDATGFDAGLESHDDGDIENTGRTAEDESDTIGPLLVHPPAESEHEDQVQLQEPRLNLGTLLFHDRLGQGRVTAVSRLRRSGEPWVRIRFGGGEFEYSPEEFERASFRSQLPDDPPRKPSLAPPHDRSESTPDSDRDASIADFTETRTDRDLSDLLVYRIWQGDGLPDPREADRSDAAGHLLRIIEAEAPLTTDRAYKLFIKGAGFSRVTKQARRPLNSALFHLAGRITIDEFENPQTNWPQRVVRLPNTPAVVVRNLGDRDLYEVPLNEIAELMRRKRGQHERTPSEALMRHVLDTYGLVRLTARAETYLRAAIQLLEDRHV